MGWCGVSAYVLDTVSRVKGLGGFHWTLHRNLLNNVSPQSLLFICVQCTRASQTLMLLACALSASDEGQCVANARARVNR